MRLTRGGGVAAAVVLVLACSGKISTLGSEGGAGDAGATGSSGGSGFVGGSSTGGSSSASGASSSGIGSSSGGTGSGSSGGSGSASSSGSGGFAGDGGLEDGGVICGPIPTLHQNPAGDIYCGTGANGAPLDCLASTGDGMCCLGGSLGGGMYEPEVCSPNAMVGCPNGGQDAGGTAAIPIQCNQVADCTANGFQGAGACCLLGAAPPAVVPGCNYLRSKGGSAVVCETSTVCGPGEVQICSSNADCPQGTTCTPAWWKIFQVGFCQ